ncbi:two-component sensor histidine kinase [Lysinibacillus xylanilyticus]|uniref:histidine kinase dimerization/phospho-acceptor domain-containing protein n=1 Tax=Lysinibacillus xylanilyticus TaxID=582475 RepID=UPI002B248885|nr:histidine kinase dimerization/phospho-acceptor domain-containing protein [Lysinibacillus xylanilyticus]MEB2301969.1 two-component sensor histidine kinase [Lysinibacillus xylanilyticus]
MVKNWKPLLALLCLIWVVFGIFTFSKVGYKYIGKSYFQSENLQPQLDDFQSELGPLVLNVPTAEDLKSKIAVTQSEIEEHRNRYGSLGEQIGNIKAQYAARIEEATSVNATDLKTKLEKERDAKIKDITTNFGDDEHVRKKILTQKKELVDKYINAVQEEAKNFVKNNNQWSYELTNTETGKTFSSGNVSDSSAFKIKFTEQHPLTTSNISSGYLNEIFYRTDTILDTEELKENFDYTGIITISKKSAQAESIMVGYNNFITRQFIFSFIWLTSIVAAIFGWKGRKEVLQMVQGLKGKEAFAKMKIDYSIGLLLISAFVYLIASQFAYSSIVGSIYPYNYVSYVIEMLLKIGFLIIIAMLFFVQVIWLYDRVNTAQKLEENLKASYLWSLGESITDLFINRSIALHSIVMIGAAFFGGGSLVAFMLKGGGFPFLVLGICTMIGFPAMILFLSRMGYLNRIMKDTKNMAEGRLNHDVKVMGKSPLADHAENLNHLREGVSTSMHEQAKSERLKTELITNVSHDLRTPLTSIITYTDLLKNPDITEEERQQYIQILDKKSERLKLLIEDLFEVSKMASGNIELHRSRVDLTQLVQQAVGEHEEDLAQAQLDLRMTKPHEPIYAYVDGQKWWRLIDNLIVNVLKYALEGTRVYVTLKRTAEGDAEFTVKNVAKYEISENADELFERFKRADASRHTEGSGLGLAIAQSIVDLHGARMSIEVDGDLFKVIVRIPTA